eukprot:TRINITY_DN1665_c0_g1_i4.p1 TRINITY_DN1665_c0_g1~~TRINITY_DN1665_c0_g1_i4.p1  ORF type:complete len:508 (-),score=68.88 TRINITY_DN1665_c0_g1_i4:13-1536(-)
MRNFLRLNDGDVLHVPFAPSEIALLHSEPHYPSISLEALSRASRKLPGRTMSDVTNFMKFEKKGYPPDSVEYLRAQSKPIVFKKPQTDTRTLHNPTTLSDLCSKREYLSTLFSWQKQRSLSSLIRFRNFQKISSTTAPGHDSVVDVKFDPIGRPRLAVGSTQSPNQAIIYNIKTGKHSILEGHKSTVSDTLFNHDGELLITASYDTTIKIWSAEEATLLRTLGKMECSVGHGDSIDRLALHPTHYKLLASCARDRTLFLWDIERGVPLRDLGRSDPSFLPKNWPGSIIDLTFGRGEHSQYLYTATDSKPSKKGQVHIWDMEVGKLVTLLEYHKESISCLSCSGSGSLLLSGSADRTVNLFDLDDQKLIHSFSTHLVPGQDLNTVSFSPCERYFQCAGEDNKVLVFDLRFPKNPAQVLHHQNLSGNVHQQGISSVQWSNSGLHLISGGEDAEVRIWDICAGGSLINSLKGHAAPVSSIAVAPCDSLIASGGDDCCVTLYSPNDNYQLE